MRPVFVGSYAIKCTLIREQVLCVRNNNYLRQWNVVNIGGDYEVGRSVRRCMCVCVCVCVCLSVCVHELEEMHSHERLLHCVSKKHPRHFRL